MAIPRVFISSTIFDLGPIRDQLCGFITAHGFTPILSENGDVFYNPSEHTHLSCIREIKHCQIFVLLIGGRYGGKLVDNNISVTHAEYREAFDQRLKIFTVVDRTVHTHHHYYITHKKTMEKAGIEYPLPPGVDNIKIFELMDEVRKKPRNNAFVPYSLFADIEQYLKKQWAGMLCDYVLQDIERDRKQYPGSLPEAFGAIGKPLIQRLSDDQLLDLKDKGLY